MKQLIKNSYILLIFFLLFLFKEPIYGLFIKTSNLGNINSSIKEIKESYYEKEYNQLLNSINLLQNANYKYMYSKIIYRDIYDFYNKITIFYGKENGIKKGSAVVDEYGLIGTISKVNKNSSVVTMLTNKDSQISIKVSNSYGILKFNNNSLIITSINNYESIENGDIIYTSGLGNLPEGIEIGIVDSIITNDLGIEKQIIVKPFVDFDNINYVAIINGDIK